ncbi:PEP-CTERM sorting domain-containing protein [Verrucomicrobiaceae bacterium N1E253]|uniref:PEP-CTERM sorting domain-containing protein n=1 Tax=Oceaniferula marina TaxID=2748318 RepID=A0A851GFL2_9BACT|nr:PEP-CTERM sorting domain-containing protein [Oceaniferula marina]
MILAGSAQAAITYVDADPTNTTLADGSALTVTTSGTNAPADGTTWHIRTSHGNVGPDIYCVAPAASAPEIRTTISGLAAGNYNLYAYYWVGGGAAPTGNNRWDIRAGLVSGALTDYEWDDAPVADNADIDPDILVDDGGARYLHQINLGVVTVDGAGLAHVYIDDFSGNDNRTWYDGVGYELVPEPSSTALLGLGGLTLMIRRRR